MVKDIRFFSRTNRYSEFSSFAAFPFEINGLIWPTVEHYFQAQKFPTPAVRAKFMAHDELRDLLVGTGKKRLIEASPFDFYWGEGRNGKGRNRLGEILMQVREELQAPAG